MYLLKFVYILSNRPSNQIAEPKGTNDFGWLGLFQPKPCFGCNCNHFAKTAKQNFGSKQFSFGSAKTHPRKTWSRTHNVSIMSPS